MTRLSRGECHNLQYDCDPSKSSRTMTKLSGGECHNLLELKQVLDNRYFCCHNGAIVTLYMDRETEHDLLSNLV